MDPTLQLDNNLQIEAAVSGCRPNITMTPSKQCLAMRVILWVLLTLSHYGYSFSHQMAVQDIRDRDIPHLFTNSKCIPPHYEYDDLIGLYSL